MHAMGKSDAGEEGRNGEMLQFLKVVRKGQTKKMKSCTDLMEVREPAVSSGEECWRQRE